MQVAQPVAQLDPERGLVGAVGQRVRVHLDDAAVPAPRPPPRSRLELVHRRDVVERAEPTRREERRRPLAHRSVEPQPPHRERRRRPTGREPHTPRLVAQPGRVSNESLQRRLVGRQHHGVGLDRRPVLEPHGQGAPAVLQRRRGHRHDHPHPEVVQVAAERRPQRRVVVVVGHVEEQPLGRSQEVGVEHRDQLAPGEVPRVREERPREHLEREMPCPVREPELVEDLRGAASGVVVVGPRERDVEQPEGRVDVDAGEVAEGEAGAARHERHEVERRPGRQPGEGVGMPAGQDQGVVGHRSQPGHGRVAASQQRAQVVVLPEERMEPAAHRRRRAVGRHRPRADPPAQGRRRLDQRHRHPALGQPGGGRESGDAAADDHGGRGPVRPGLVRRRRRRVPDRVQVATGDPVVPRTPEGHHAGRRPWKVWMIPFCQPRTDRVRTSSNPASTIRRMTVSTGSMSITLRQR